MERLGRSTPYAGNRDRFPKAKRRISARVSFILPRLAAPLLGAAVVCLSWLVLRGDFREDGSLPQSGANQLGQAPDSAIVLAHPHPDPLPKGKGTRTAAVSRPIHRDGAVTTAAYPEPTPAAQNVPQPLPQPAGSLLMPSQPPVVRSEQLEKTAQQADQQIRRGFGLANRGACYAARAEFVAALRMLAQALDAEHRTTNHSRSLSAALTAMKEAQDFLPTGGRFESDLEMPTLIASHRTPILKGAATENLVPLLALKAYFTFAQAQLAAAADREVAGSMALYALGKLHAVVSQRKTADLVAAESKAVVFYQAALLTCPQNHMAANDLGVLLAHGGYYPEARSALERSVSILPQSANLNNLAIVYQRLGQPAMADQARRQAESVRRGEIERLRTRQASANGAVQWIDPKVFAEMGVEPADPAAAPGKKVSQNPLPLPTALTLTLSQRERGPMETIVLCQALGPAAPYNICGVDCADGCQWGCRHGWEAARLIYWQAYAQGEYVGHERLPHVAEYRFRVDDQLEMVFRLTRDETPTPYRLNVGDEIRVESFTDPELNRDLILQPDGTITLRLLGQVHATGRTVVMLTAALDELYKKYYKVPAITVTPLRVNTQLEDLRNTIDRRAGIGGQSQTVRVTPEGTISLPAIGSLYAQGLSLTELQQEINERYREKIEGMEVMPILAQRAPRYVYVLGEVNQPGRFEMVGPTTALQALSLAGSWRVGANLKQIVIFRRGDDWRLLATMVNLDAALHGKQPCPPGELWLDDSDVVIVPKSAILVADDFINLVFTRGIYGVFPMSGYVNFGTLGTI